MFTTRRQVLKQTLAASALPLTLPCVSTLPASAANIDAIFKALIELSAGGPPSMHVLFPQGCIENIMPVASIFTDKTGIEVKFIETTVDEINLHMLNSAASGTSDFDIALPATFGIPDLAEAGAIADLTAFFAKYKAVASDAVSLYDLGDTYKGRKYGYQTDGDVYLMFYNNDFFKNAERAAAYEDKFGTKAGIPQTWAELDQMMEFFHQPDEGLYGGCMYRTPLYILWEWWVRMHAAGGYPVTDGFEASLASDAGVQALEELFRATDFQHPTVRDNGLFDNWRIYGEGNCFANIGWGGTQKYLNSERSLVQQKLSYAPTPQVSYFNWGWDYVVSEFSSHKELAYLFCLLASLPEISTLAVRENGFFDPFRTEHYDDAEIQKVYSHEFLKAHKEGMTNAIPDFYVEGQGRYLNALRDNISSALEGIISPETALKFTEFQWNNITEEIGYERQVDQWKRLKSSYPV